MLELCANVQWADLRDICLADFYIGLISAIVITVSCICWCFLLRTKPCDIKSVLFVFDKMPKKKREEFLNTENHKICKRKVEKWKIM